MRLFSLSLLLHRSIVQVVDDLIIQTDKKTNDLEVDKIVDRHVRKGLDLLLHTV